MAVKGVKGAGVALLAVLAVAGATSANAATSTHSCIPVSAYLSRVQQAFDAYREARLSLVQDIRLAKFMPFAPSSPDYMKWDAADAAAAQREAKFSTLAKLQGSHQDALACHAEADAKQLQPYLFALTNLEIADNLLFQARGDLLATCNSSATLYAPYLHASDQAVAMAKKDISGTIKAKSSSDYLAEMPDELANMREIQRVCN